MCVKGVCPYDGAYLGVCQGESVRKYVKVICHDNSLCKADGVNLGGMSG